MENITEQIRSSTFEAGMLIKNHGVGGKLVLRLHQPADDILDFPEWIFIRIWGQPVPFEIEEESVYQKDSRHLVIGLTGIDDQGKARQLIGNACFLEGNWSNWFVSASMVPGTWIGATVLEITTGRTGTVTGYQEIKGNPLIEIEFNGKTILVPFNPEFIIEADEQDRKLTVKIPPELFSIYE
jgi:16S rRNA processing protein RimM